MCTHAFLELVAHELFEHWPYHVEQERLTDNVHLLQAERHGFLQVQTRVRTGVTTKDCVYNIF